MVVIVVVVILVLCHHNGMCCVPAEIPVADYRNTPTTEIH